MAYNGVIGMRIFIFGLLGVIFAVILTGFVNGIVNRTKVSSASTSSATTASGSEIGKIPRFISEILLDNCSLTSQLVPAWFVSEPEYVADLTW